MKAVVLPRHSLLVRITHWINAITFFALVISGAAILIAHPRLYWGETGAFGSPALLELPLPLNLDQSGWGRSLHFLSAWVCSVNGLLYVSFGFRSNHFGFRQTAAYNTVQRIAYQAVVFALFPIMILTGLALSPAIGAVFPFIVRLFGGYQSSRTVHFFVANALIVFLVVHVIMVYLSGFRRLMRTMITGREPAALKETL